MAMNILSVSPIYPTQDAPASGVFVLQRAMAMQAYSNIQVAKLIPWYRHQEQPNRSSSGPKLSIHKFFYVPKFLKSLDCHFASRVIHQIGRRLKEKNGVDLIDAHFGYPTGTACLMAGQRLSLPTFVTLRGCEVDWFKVPTIRNRLVETLSNCAGVIAVSDFLKNACVDAGLAANKVQVIPNAVSQARFSPADKNASREKLGIDPNERLIVSVAKLNQVKRLDLLIDAFATLRQDALYNDDQPLRLVIVGGPDYDRKFPKQLQRQIQERQLQQSVTITGAVAPESVPSWLQAADVFSLASDREGSCNAVREALSCGIPVVVTNVGDNASIVRDVNGVLIETNNVQQLTDGIRLALDREWDADEISQSIQMRTWDDVGREVVEYMGERV